MLGKGKEASEAEPSAESRSASLDSSALSVHPDDGVTLDLNVQ